MSSIDITQSNTVQPPQQFDPAVVALMHGMKMQEGGGKIDYNAIGDNGTAGGAGQWSNQPNGKPIPLTKGQIPYNFQQAAKQYGLDPNDFSPDNQNKVLYNEISAGKKSGLTPEQILSAHNSGDPNKYLSSNSSGIGSVGPYDVVNYVKNAMSYAQKYHQSQPTTSATSIDTTSPPGGPNTYGATFQANQNDNPVVAGLKSLGNVPSSLLNLGKSLFSAATHPINTIKGIGNAFAGGIEEGFNKLVGEDGAHNNQTETFDALKSALNERYGSLENAQRTATNDPVGFGADVFSILEGGSAVLDGVTGTSTRAALDTAVTKVGGAVSDVGAKVLGAPASIGAKILGQSTGVGSEAIKTGFQAASEGGEASKAFTEGLRGNTTPEGLVDKARGALDEVVDTRRSNYREMLKTLKTDASTIDTTPIKTQLDKTLDNFNIKKGTDGELDFSESTMVNPSDQTKVKAIVDDVENWKNNTPEGIDTLKQRLSNYYEPGSKIGAFSEGLRSTARGLIENTPGYSDAMKNYSEMSDTIKDIRQSLSLGDKAAVETSFNKLKNALKNDKQFRQSVIEELDAATGGTVKESIAGQGMSKLAPSGLSKYADIGVAGTALSHGVGILPILGLAIGTSPRIVGEIVNALGLGTRGAKLVMSYVNKIATPAVIAGSAASK